MKRLWELLGFGSSAQKEPVAVTEPFTAVSDRGVAEVCRDFELHEEAKPYVDGNPAPHEFVQRLAQAELYADAIRYLTYALPRREAIWWACMSVRNAPACCGDEIAAEALEAAEEWVKDPSEENRETALTAGDEHNFDMPGAPAAWTAMAAGWSDEAIAADDDEDVPESPKHLTAHAASGAILLVATMEPEQAEKVYRKCLETGVQIAQGKMQMSA